MCVVVGVTGCVTVCYVEQSKRNQFIRPDPTHVPSLIHTHIQDLHTDDVGLDFRGHADHPVEGLCDGERVRDGEAALAGRDPCQLCGMVGVMVLVWWEVVSSL